MKKIGIVGAGIAGLTLANFINLEKKYEFVIYEKLKSLSDVGVGIQLSPNSVRILNSIRFNKYSMKDIFKPKKIDFFSLNNKKMITQLDLNQFNTEYENYTCTKRSNLINFLSNNLFSNQIIFDKEILDFSTEQNKINIFFSDGSKEQIDILVASDGVFSKIRSKIYPKITPIYSGAVAYRGIVNPKNVDGIDLNNISLLLGDNAHVVMYPINQKKEINFAAIVRYKNNKHFSKDCLNNKIKKNSLTWDKSIKKVLDIYQNFDWWPIYEINVGHAWYKKNVIFIGDSAHAMPPFLAQGASQSIESAHELFKILTLENNDNISSYYKTRIKRIKIIHRKSKFNYFVFHLSNPILVFIRNIVLKIIVKNKFFLNRYLGQVYLKK